jgi:hypothetical protein
MTDPRVCSDCGCELEEDEIGYCHECSEADDWADEDDDDGKEEEE